MKFKILRTLRAEQITNPINSYGDGIIKIVDDRNPKAFIEKLNHSVRANETGSFGNQNRLFQEISMERMRERKQERIPKILCKVLLGNFQIRFFFSPETNKQRERPVIGQRGRGEGSDYRRR